MPGEKVIGVCLYRKELGRVAISRHHWHTVSIPPHRVSDRRLLESYFFKMGRDKEYLVHDPAPLPQEVYESLQTFYGGKPEAEDEQAAAHLNENFAGKLSVNIEEDGETWDLGIPKVLGRLVNTRVKCDDCTIDFHVLTKVDPEEAREVVRNFEFYRRLNYVGNLTLRPILEALNRRC